MWPNGRMDQDATWYEGRLWVRQHCVRSRPSSTPFKRHSDQFSADVYCGQTAEWIKMPLGTKVDLGPGHIVLDGDPAPAAPEKKDRAPNVRPLYIVAKRSPISATADHLFQFALELHKVRQRLCAVASPTICVHCIQYTSCHFTCNK